MKTRMEKDSLGERPVPAEAYYGIQTQRALENYPISGLRAHERLIRAMGYIKKAAALANRELKLLDNRRAAAIIRAADEVIDGKLDDHFPVDIYQAGAGVSFHMNTNEVIANRAIEFLGGARGDYSVVNPNDHVNFGQSTNDVFPTAMRLARDSSIRRSAGSDGDFGEIVCAQGERVRSHSEIRPHAHDGRGAHTTGAGVRGLCHRDASRQQWSSGKRRTCCVNWGWAVPPWERA